MKVLHLFNELKFSGAEIMYVDAAPIFKANGCQLTAMATSERLGEYAQYFEKAGYDLLHKPYPKFTNLWSRLTYYRTFVNLLKQEKFDVVHIHRSNAMWGIALCAWLSGITSVYTFHNVFSTRKITYLYHCMLRWSAKNIFNCRFQTISDSVYDNELNHFYNDTSKVYNWYGANRFYPAHQGEKEKVREELGIPLNTLILISIGGCSPIKNHYEVIKALPKVLEKFPNSIYLHLGEGCTEDEEKALAEELGISNNIRFCGNQSEVRKYLIASDIYLMTSKFEGIPITTIEALACCIPAILYDVPGLRDFNKNGENCIIIPEDFQVLSEKICSLKENPEVANTMAARAKAFVDAEFYMYKNAQLVYNLYK